MRRGIETGQDLSDMNIGVLKGFSSAIDADVYAMLTLDGSVAARNHVGGTAPEQVRAAIKRARKRL